MERTVLPGREMYPSAQNTRILSHAWRSSDMAGKYCMPSSAVHNDRRPSYESQARDCSERCRCRYERGAEVHLCVGRPWHRSDIDEDDLQCVIADDAADVLVVYMT